MDTYTIGLELKILFNVTCHIKWNFELWNDGIGTNLFLACSVLIADAFPA